MEDTKNMSLQLSFVDAKDDIRTCGRKVDTHTNHAVVLLAFYCHDNMNMVWLSKTERL